jgi:radical SAM superfamily enzyme YgiQ (UPF0313 family)
LAYPPTRGPIRMPSKRCERCANLLRKHCESSAESIITCLPHSLDEVFDLGVIGDGEEALRAIVSTASLRDLENAPGVCYMHVEKLTINPFSNQDVSLPIPLLHKYALRSYQSGSVGFVTSRGCPFKCAFCPLNPEANEEYTFRKWKHNCDTRGCG